MIEGTITCLEQGYVFQVEGVDNCASMQLELLGGTVDAWEFIDGGRTGDIAFSFGETKVTVGVDTYVQDGKTHKYDCNMEFFCDIATIIRWMKSNCKASNRRGFDDDTVSRESEYDVDVLGEKGYVKLNLGVLDTLYVEVAGYRIDLHTTDSNRIFKAIKNGKQSGLRFDVLYAAAGMGGGDALVGVGLYETLEEVIEAHPEKELSWLLEKNYQIVTDETLPQVVEYIKNHEGYVFYDTETTGLNITFKSRTGEADECVGVILSVKFGESFFFPLQMKTIKNLCNGDHRYVMTYWLKPILEGKELVVHNLAFDWKVGYIYDINCNIVHDTYALYHLTYGAEYKNYPAGLKEITKMLLGRDSLELDDFIPFGDFGSNDVRFWDLPENLVRLYACADTDNTQGIFEYAMNNDLLNKYGAAKAYEIEVAFSYAVGYQEFYGHLIDIDSIPALREDIQKGIDENKAKMVEIAGYDFNPNSSQVLMRIMYDELGYPEQIARNTGKRTSNKEAVKALGHARTVDGDILYPFCNYLLKYREYEGVRKIIDKFPEHMTKDGYLFSGVMQYGASTGRVSVNKPNYQGYNNPVKKNVIPRPGYWMSDSDYSSVEYRVLGSMVGNKRIMESFVDPDFDYHQYQAARMYSVQYASVTKAMRGGAKGINFGLPYGMGDESLGARIFGKATPENTKKAKALRVAYFKGQEDIRDWFEGHRNKGVREGYTETFFGRRRYYHRSDFSEGAIRRQAGNAVIQGCLGGDTRIQTKEYGIVRISTVVGECLNVWDGENWTRGTVAYSGKKRKCVVEFQGGMRFVCSPDHKFLVVSHKGNERFVRCEDLKEGVHRVRVNPNYMPSDCRYASDSSFEGAAYNSYNITFDAVGDSYGEGLLLGRLASDGNYTVRDDGGSCVSWVVAEHEYNILETLRASLANIEFNERTSDRADRTEQITHLDVYSKRLCCECEDIDVRHSIDDKFFSDTELLRGYLSGFADGDGGVSGKTITVVWGSQYDFEPMVRDFQKALLFFGVRSRYRKYDDRYVLAIMTYDNERFLDLIGFMNKDKQEAGRSLHTKKDGHVFGRALMVKSVTVTDEYIDMYDVCNTDRGYYVADGLITHNTAADIYKLAVGRMFKRIVREGWLGKVLFTGFIHDEILCEVSNDINPMVWLRVIREEFEVKIDGWCPLYMGFGFGMSWYEAKSTEIPVKMQWELVNKWGNEGYPDWDGNGRAFCDKIPGMIHEFEIRDSIAQLTDEESQGKEIKPALNKQLIGLVEGEVGKLDNTDTQYVIDRFCELFHADRGKINVLNIPEAGTSAGAVGYSDVPEEWEENSVDVGVIRDMMLRSTGCYIDRDEYTVTIVANMAAKLINSLKERSCVEGRGYRLCLATDNGVVPTATVLREDAMTWVSQTCAMLRKRGVA